MAQDSRGDMPSRRRGVRELSGRASKAKLRLSGARASLQRLWSKRARGEHIRLPADKQRIDAVVAAFSCCGSWRRAQFDHPNKHGPQQAEHKTMS